MYFRSFSNSSGRSRDITISEGMYTFVLSGEQADLSRRVFLLLGEGADNGSNDMGHISDDCTTLPSHIQIELRLICYSRNFLLEVRQVAFGAD
jgi:hypothetical protein